MALRVSALVTLHWHCPPFVGWGWNFLWTPESQPVGSAKWRGLSSIEATSFVISSSGRLAQYVQSSFWQQEIPSPWIKGKEELTQAASFSCMGTAFLFARLSLSDIANQHSLNQAAVWKEICSLRKFFWWFYMFCHQSHPRPPALPRSHALTDIHSDTHIFYTLSVITVLGVLCGPFLNVHTLLEYLSKIIANIVLNMGWHFRVPVE